jgi:small subunit ribosomal protein S6
LQTDNLEEILLAPGESGAQSREEAQVLTTYETIIITTPELPEDDEKALIESMISIVTERDGKLHINDRMGRRRMAYPIQKLDDGIYTRLLYESGSDAPQEMERRLRISDKVLRVMTVRLEKEWADDARKGAVQLIADREEAARRAIEEAEEAARKAEEAAAAAAAAEAAGPPEDAAVAEVDAEADTAEVAAEDTTDAAEEATAVAEEATVVAEEATVVSDAAEEITADAAEETSEPETASDEAAPEELPEVVKEGEEKNG